MGTRLAPLTNNDNKHLLPVFDRRMIEIPVQTLVDAGVDDIILITGGNRPGAFLELLRNGASHGIRRLYYTYQVGNGGIADALALAEPFIDPVEKCVVILGDNYFEDGIKDAIKKFMVTGGEGASCVLKKVDNASRFGVAQVRNQTIISIEEKPEKPKSNLAILGCYLFDDKVWDFVKQIEPSARGELEITDVLRHYMEAGQLQYSIYRGYWSDMGMFDSLAEVSQRLAEKGI